jgi:signal transduction histidine kinase
MISSISHRLARWTGYRPHRLGITLPRSETRRLERVLAAGRLLLAACALFAVRMEVFHSVRQETSANLLLITYLLYSLVLLLLLRVTQGLSSRATWGVHLGDIAWVGAIGLLTTRPETLYIGFCLFVLVAAAYRWGFSECVLTIVALIGVLVVDTLLAGVSAALPEGVTLYHVAVRSAYVAILGVLVGQIAEQNRRLREEPLAIARLIRKARVDAGMRGTVHGVLSELLRILPARRVLLALWETGRERLFLWTGELRAGVTDLQLELLPMDAARRPWYFPIDAPHSYHLVWNEKGAPDVLAMDGDGQPLHDLRSFRFPADFRDAHPFGSLASVGFTFGGEWESRIFLLEPRFGSEREAELRFFQNAVREVNPAVHNVYLLRTLRQRASAMERARVARELHDGAIQSLISVEMQMDVLRRRCGDLGPEQRESELRRLQSVVHNQVLDLRDLMQQMKPLDLDPRQMPDFLAEVVERFRHDSGIEARFVTELDAAKVPPRVARELARIVQEALANIRRHSGARHAIVQFARAEDGGWKLVVDDDGRGFDFQGCLDLAQLDQARKGPLVIKERVRSIGADLKIDSEPGRGARLEIHMPRKAHAAHR